MEDSVTYQKIVSEGRLEGERLGRLEQARSTLIRLGAHNFQTCDPAVRERVEAITDLERLRRCLDRIFSARDWAELLDDEGR